MPPQGTYNPSRKPELPPFKGSSMISFKGPQAPSRVMETGATLAEALSPPSPAGLPLGESPLSPGASPAEGSRGKRLSSRKGFLGHARAKYGL